MQGVQYRSLFMLQNVALTVGTNVLGKCDKMDFLNELAFHQGWLGRIDARKVDSMPLHTTEKSWMTECMELGDRAP
jgi:hypothetical protein